ncbi:unknown [Bacteroides sp. CAG:443]|nr:unknown [Bacteroides sp. CAG:443]
MRVVEHHRWAIVEIFRNLRTQMNFFVHTTDSIRTTLMLCDKDLLTNRRTCPSGEFFHLVDEATAHHYFLTDTISQFGGKARSFQNGDTEYFMIVGAYIIHIGNIHVFLIVLWVVYIVSAAFHKHFLISPSHSAYIRKSF